MATDKHDNLLKIIIEEYVETATPVGSGVVVEKYLPDLSSATVRNYMAELEDQGLIFQPHTSAGRIPTIAGYKRYLEFSDNQSGAVSAKAKKLIADAVKSATDQREAIKALAKALAEISGQAILVGFGPQDVYYTGISNLFRQPEFIEQGLIYSMSEVIDHLDEVMVKVFHDVGDDVQILIGEENPFGQMASTVMARCLMAKNDGLIGILGPVRMDYPESISLLSYVKEYLRDNIKK